MAHAWAWPFAAPVDVVGLGLTDYHVIIKRPMDLGTVKARLEAGGYDEVDDLEEDVALVFSNAMTYNAPHMDVHIMAKFLLGMFERKYAAVRKAVEEDTVKWQAEENMLATPGGAAMARGDAGGSEDSVVKKMSRKLSVVERELQALKAKKSNGGGKRAEAP
eukprot:SM009087S24277  [mRNA]  locus=s9087:87:569:+ [translate_table: standard]